MDKDVKGGVDMKGCGFTSYMAQDNKECQKVEGAHKADPKQTG